MKKLISVLALSILFSTTLFAAWAMIDLDELVADTDLIVVGTLHSATENSEGIGNGYIRVDRVVTPGIYTLNNRPLEPGDNLKITWADNWACASGMHLRWENEKGIWLLKIENLGIVAADYPGRFRPLSDLHEIKSLLRRKPSPKVGRVDVLAASAGEFNCPNSFVAANGATAVDVAPFNEYSPQRALIVLFLSLGLYWILYRSRFRIR